MHKPRTTLLSASVVRSEGCDHVCAKSCLFIRRCVPLHYVHFVRMCVIFCPTLSVLPLLSFCLWSVFFSSLYFLFSFFFLFLQLSHPPTPTSRKFYFLTHYLSIEITITHPFRPHFIAPFNRAHTKPQKKRTHTTTSITKTTPQQQPQRRNKDETAGTSVVPRRATGDPGYDLCVAVEA